MTCDRARQDRVFEQYLTGALNSKTRQRFERHYFGCEQCAAELAAWQAIERPLREMAPEIRSRVTPSPLGRIWMWLGVAAGILILAGVYASWRSVRSIPKPPVPTSSYIPDYATLGRLTPPAYEAPPAPKAESASARKFKQAMQSYLKQDYRTATHGLEEVLRLDPQNDEARFYLGSSYLIFTTPVEAARELEKVADGSSPFATRARMALARAWLKIGAKERALKNLQILAAAPGEFHDEALQLIAKVNGPQ